MSFDVLGLLTNALKLALDVHDQDSDVAIGHLRAGRIYLAILLLQQEIQLPPHWLAHVQKAFELCEVGVQAGHLFSDVAAFGEEHHFLRKPCRIDLYISKQAADAGLQFLPVVDEEGGESAFDLLQPYFDKVNTLQNITPQCLALTQPHGAQVCHSDGEDFLNPWPEVFDVMLIFLHAGDLTEFQERRELPLTAKSQLMLKVREG